MLNKRWSYFVCVNSQFKNFFFIIQLSSQRQIFLKGTNFQEINLYVELH